MAHQLRALTEDLSLVPSTYGGWLTITWGSDTSGLQGHLYACTQTHTQIQMHIHNKNKLFHNKNARKQMNNNKNPTIGQSRNIANLRPTWTI